MSIGERIDKVHLPAAAIAGVGVSVYRSREESDYERLLEVLGGLLGGCLGGVLPDLLDLPTSPNHRGLAHGGVAVVALVKRNSMGAVQRLRESADAFRHAAQDLSLSPQVRKEYALREALCRLAAGFVVGVQAGYLSHLALDLFTPRGLPPISWSDGRLQRTPSGPTHS